MKYLLLILLSFNITYASDNCIADKPCKVLVTPQGNSAKFKTTQEAKAWAIGNEKILHGRRHLNSFGKVKRWLRKDLGNSIDTEVVTYVDVKHTAVVDENGDPVLDPDGDPIINTTEIERFYTKYKYAQTYQINYIDLTQKVADRAKADADERIERILDLRHTGTVGAWRLKMIRAVEQLRRDCGK